MDSVIAKLDNSVFGMLTDQGPRILIDGICNPEETERVNRLRPDFVRFDAATAHGGTIGKATMDGTAARPMESNQRIVIAPGIKVISSVGDIPLYSSAVERRTLAIDTNEDASKLPSKIRKKSPDLLIITLAGHDEAALKSLEKLVHSARSIQQDFVD